VLHYADQLFEYGCMLPDDLCVMAIHLSDNLSAFEMKL